MAKTRVTPTVVTVGKRKYRVVTVSPQQKAGVGDWAAGEDIVETFKGERVAVLKPV